MGIRASSTTPERKRKMAFSDSPSKDSLPTFVDGVPLWKQLSIRKLNAIMAYIRSITPVKGVGTILTRTAAGTAINVQRTPAAISEEQTFPYKGTDASTGATPRVNIQVGSHNSLMPTISGVPMIDNPILVIGSSAQIVYIQTDWTNRQLQSCLINSSNSISPPANSINSSGTGSAYQTLFYTIVTIDGGVASVSIFPNVLGAQGCQICGTLPLFWGI
jgi:hypothetical protein